jgi:hypothetical protein
VLDGMAGQVRPLLYNGVKAAAQALSTFGAAELLQSDPGEPTSEASWSSVAWGGAGPHTAWRRDGQAAAARGLWTRARSTWRARRRLRQPAAETRSSPPATGGSPEGRHGA